MSIGKDAFGPVLTRAVISVLRASKSLTAQLIDICEDLRSLHNPKEPRSSPWLRPLTKRRRCGLLRQPPA
jgi:hypothetical protein